MKSQETQTIHQAWSHLLDEFMHDLVSPLAVARFNVQTLTELLQDILQGYQLALEHNLITGNNAVDLQEIKDEYLPHLQQTIDKTFELMDKLHAYKKTMFADKNQQLVLLNNLIQQVLVTLNSLNNEKIIIQSIPDFHTVIEPFWLKTIFMHWFEHGLNAIEHNQGEISLWHEQNNHLFKIHFKATGIGFTDKEQVELFNHYFTKRDNEVIPDLGFCRLAILLKGGDITCESLENKHLHFVLHMPEN